MIIYNNAQAEHKDDAEEPTKSDDADEPRNNDDADTEPILHVPKKRKLQGMVEPSIPKKSRN